MSTTGFGRPSRKYFRLPVYESDQSSGLLEPILVNFIDTTITAVINDGGPNLCDLQGQLLTNVAVFGNVSMRQLRRGSKRRATPVLP